MRRAQANPPVHRMLANVPTGYPLNPARAWVSVIVPQSTTNLFTNPSFETNTTGWTAVADSGAFTRTNNQQCRGAAAAVLTIGGGGTYIQITSATPTVTTVYALSCHIRAPNGRPVTLAAALAVYNGTTNPWGRLDYIGNGWWRASVVFTATTTNGVGVRVLGVQNDEWCVDACQLESSSIVTSYCDGDEQGLLPFESPPPFRWNGTPHASTSSRSAATRAGGIERPLDYYSLTLVSMQGLGAGPVENIFTPLGNAPGAIYQTTEYPERTFTLGGRFEASDPGLLSRKRGALRRDLSASLSGLAQPLRLILQKYRDTVAIGDQVYADCSYAGGLEGDDASLYSEDVAVQFVQYQPDLVRVVSYGVELDASDSISNMRLFRRAATGVYTGESTVNGSIEPNALIYAPNGKFYIGGAFTTPGTRVVAYNPTTSAFETLSTGLSGTVRALCYAPDGTLYAGGSFTIGANTGAVASWNGSAWSIVGGASGLAGTCYALVYDSHSEVICAAGTNSGNCVLAQFSGGTWFSNILTPTAGTIYDLEINPRTNVIYIAGDFVNLDGVAIADYLAQMVSASGAVGGIAASGANGIAYSVTIDSANIVYASGAFTAVGGISADGFAQWNGSAWSAMQNIQTSAAPRVWYDRYRDAVWCIGVDLTPLNTNNITVAWKNGAILYPGTPELNAASSASGISSIAASGDLLFFGSFTVMSLNANGVTGITYPGTSPASPLITTTRSASSFLPLSILESAETRQQVQVTNQSLSLGAGDRSIIDIGRYRIASDRSGDLTFLYTQDSSVGFVLIPGVNTLNAYNVNSNTTNALYVYPRYLSFDDTVPGVE